MSPDAGRLALLTPAEMAEADRLTIAGGTPGIVLMERAGAAVARAIAARWARRPVVVLCGPGNNGGDGFVIARRLAEAEWPAQLALLGERAKLKGDAALAAARWDGAVVPVVAELAATDAIFVDALFGAGLDRPVEGIAAATLAAVAAAGRTIVAVDMPSGLNGADGSVLGRCAGAALTVTFFRRKSGHLLLPGRALCGEVVVADIGIPTDVLDTIAPRCWANGPALWGDAFPRPAAEGHKYHRGHALLLGGGAMTGAARLAARAARRIGAGLVTVAAPEAAVPVYQADMPGLIVAPASRWAELLADRRHNAVLIGPGGEVGASSREAVAAVRAAGKALVLDAAGLTSFAGEAEALARLLDEDCAVTPHQAEFDGLFGAGQGARIDRARAAAATLGAVVVLKGADTMVAAPDGRLTINDNAPPDLATGGTGDVLAGMILGLRAQGMPAFEAACAAVWLHGAAGAAVGRGLIAEDLVDALPGVLP